jgi:Protein of unknown function (DUF1573)
MKLQRVAAVISGLVIVSGIAATTNAQALDTKDLAPANPSLISPALEGQGRLTFLSTVQDTGEILDTEIANLAYLFRNTGAGPLTITQVKPSCGCTIPELAKKTYMPGESGTLDVTFDPRGKHGAVARSITVFTDSKSTPNSQLVVRSLVKPVIVIEPNVLAFDAVAKGHGATKEFKIYGRIDDFKVTRATVEDSTSFSIEVIDGGMAEKDGENLHLQILRLTLKPDAKPDNHRTQITVRTNDERKPIFTLASVARVLGDLKMNPVRVTMGRMVVGDEFEREFHVTSKSGKPFTISSVNANTVALDAIYEFEPVNEQRTDWIVRIKGTVTNAAPRFNTQLHIVTDVPDEEQQTVQMYGQLRR